MCVRHDWCMLPAHAELGLRPRAQHVDVGVGSVCLYSVLYRTMHADTVTQHTPTTPPQRAQLSYSIQCNINSKHAMYVRLHAQYACDRKHDLYLLLVHVLGMWLIHGRGRVLEGVELVAQASYSHVQTWTMT